MAIGAAGGEREWRHSVKTRQAVEEYILKEFLPGANPDELTDATPLISGKVLDSLATLTLVAFLEERFGLRIEAYEADIAHLDTLPKIAGLVHSKM